MCGLCLRSGKAVASHLLGRATQGGGMVQLLENGLKAGQMRFFSSLPAPDESGQAPTSLDGYVAHPKLLNENVLKAEYAVRGALYNKAVEMQNQGADIIYTNGGAGG